MEGWNATGHSGPGRAALCHWSRTVSRPGQVSAVQRLWLLGRDRATVGLGRAAANRSIRSAAGQCKPYGETDKGRIRGTYPSSKDPRIPRVPLPFLHRTKRADRCPDNIKLDCLGVFQQQRCAISRDIIRRRQMTSGTDYDIYDLGRRHDGGTSEDLCELCPLCHPLLNAVRRG